MKQCNVCGLRKATTVIKKIDFCTSCGKLMRSNKTKDGWELIRRRNRNPDKIKEREEEQNAQ